MILKGCSPSRIACCTRCASDCLSALATFIWGRLFALFFSTRHPHRGFKKSSSSRAHTCSIALVKPSPGFCKSSSHRDHESGSATSGPWVREDDLDLYYFVWLISTKPPGYAVYLLWWSPTRASTKDIQDCLLCRSYHWGTKVRRECPRSDGHLNPSLFLSWRLRSYCRMLTSPSNLAPTNGLVWMRPNSTLSTSPTVDK